MGNDEGVPKIFVDIAAALESQQNEIESLKVRVALLELEAWEDEE
jgi:hypothetical protein